MTVITMVFNPNSQKGAFISALIILIIVGGAVWSGSHDHKPEPITEHLLAVVTVTCDSATWANDMILIAASKPLNRIIVHDRVNGIDRVFQGCTYKPTGELAFVSFTKEQETALDGALANVK